MKAFHSLIFTGVAVTLTNQLLIRGLHEQTGWYSDSFMRAVMNLVDSGVPG